MTGDLRLAEPLEIRQEENAPLGFRNLCERPVQPPSILGDTRLGDGIGSVFPDGIVNLTKRSDAAPRVDDAQTIERSAARKRRQPVRGAPSSRVEVTGLSPDLQEDFLEHVLRLGPAAQYVIQDAQEHGCVSTIERGIRVPITAGDGREKLGVGSPRLLPGGLAAIDHFGTLLDVRALPMCTAPPRNLDHHSMR